MRIGIDARLWSEAGVGRYIRNLVFNLAELDGSTTSTGSTTLTTSTLSTDSLTTGKKNEYFLFLLKKNLGQNLPKNFTEVEADFGWYGVTEQIKLPILLNKYNLDLVHFPHFNIPIFYPGKFIVTIHDLIHQHHKMRRATTLNPLVYQIKHFAYNQAFKTSLKKSSKIITVSNFVKKQLMEEMGVSANKIVVTYEAVEENILEVNKKIPDAQIKKTLEKFKIKPPFIFYVGNAHPHKNVEGLIKAFRKVKQSVIPDLIRNPEQLDPRPSVLSPSGSKDFRGNDIVNLQLVLSGHDHYFWQRVKKEFQISNDVIFTGFITDEELVALYKSAQAFVMPSFEEGFGIPLLEAMACGCPVVCSSAGSLPEVGGDAAEYFDPKNIADMAEKIQKLLDSPRHPELVSGSHNLRKQLIEKGQKRYQEFSWKKLAEETLKVYEQV